MTATMPADQQDKTPRPGRGPRTAQPLPLRSLVPAEVTLAWADRQVHIAPLGRTELSAGDVASIDPARLADCKFVQREEPVVDHSGLGWFAVVAVAAAVALAGLLALTDGWWPLLFLAIGAIGAVTLLSLTFRQGALLIGQWMRDKAAVLLVLCIGFAAPAASLLFATSLFQDLTNPASHPLQPPLSTTVTLRALQVLFLGVAITFPALLFFLFDRQRGDMLRKRFEFHMFRFDPRVTTLTDVEAYYGLQMDAAFGSSRTARDRGRPQVSHRAPIVIATLVLAVGWIVTSINLQALTTGGASAASVLADLFRPDSSVLAFGFLGSYYFTINIVLRSYVRGDLHPKTYSQVTTRVLEVVVVTALLSVTDVVPHELAIAVAFFAGVVPDIVLQRVWELSRPCCGPAARTRSPRTSRSPSSMASTSTNEPVWAARASRTWKPWLTGTSSTCYSRRASLPAGSSTGSTRPSSTCTRPAVGTDRAVSSVACSTPCGPPTSGLRRSCCTWRVTTSGVDSSSRPSAGSCSPRTASICWPARSGRHPGWRTSSAGGRTSSTSRSSTSSTPGTSAPSDTLPDRWSRISRPRPPRRGVAQASRTMAPTTKVRR